MELYISCTYNCIRLPGTWGVPQEPSLVETAQRSVEEVGVDTRPYYTNLVTLADALIKQASQDADDLLTLATKGNGLFCVQIPLTRKTPILALTSYKFQHMY